MIPNINCFTKKLNCQLANAGLADQLQLKALWVRKKYARASTVEIVTEDLFLGYFETKTVNAGIIGTESGLVRNIQLKADDWQIKVTKQHVYSWFKTDVDYYCFQDTYTDVLDEYGNIQGYRCKLLEVMSREPQYFTLILRERTEERLSSNVTLPGQTRD